MTKLSKSMKQAVLMIGSVYWLEGIRWDTYQALLRRGLIVRRPGVEENVVGLTGDGMSAYWDALKEQGEAND